LRDTPTQRKENAMAHPEDDDQAREFGKHLHFIRTQVFNEPLRAFAKRTGLSHSYLAKAEQGVVGVMKRSTILSLAEKLQTDPTPLLLSAGYLPRGGQPTDTTLALLFAQLDAGQQQLVREFVNLVRTTGAQIPPK
jgi:transcriptional regulator with XRE-family HTH domain